MMTTSFEYPWDKVDESYLYATVDMDGSIFFWKIKPEFYAKGEGWFFPNGHSTKVSDVTSYRLEKLPRQTESESEDSLRERAALVTSVTIQPAYDWEWAESYDSTPNWYWASMDRDGCVYFWLQEPHINGSEWLMKDGNRTLKYPSKPDNYRQFDWKQSLQKKTESAFLHRLKPTLVGEEDDYHF